MLITAAQSELLLSAGFGALQCVHPVVLMLVNNLLYFSVASVSAASSASQWSPKDGSELLLPFVAQRGIHSQLSQQIVLSCVMLLKLICVASHSITVVDAELFQSRNPFYYRNACVWWAPRTSTYTAHDALVIIPRLCDKSCTPTKGSRHTTVVEWSQPIPYYAYSQAHHGEDTSHQHTSTSLEEQRGTMTDCDPNNRFLRNEQPVQVPVMALPVDPQPPLWVCP